MGSNEKFCLRWNDFESNISVAFRELRDEKDFFDVTLACDDSQLQAHKVILSACSPFFRNILKKNPHQHPLLYLKGVKYKELQCVLNFMYQGEVNVAQEELNSFLSVAEELRVKGLTQNNAESSSSSNSARSDNKSNHRSRDPPERDHPAPPVKKPRISPPSVPAEPSNDDDIQEVVPVKSEPRDLQPVMVGREGGYQDTSQPGTVALQDTYGEDGYEYEEYEEGYDESSFDTTAGMQAGPDGNKDLLSSYLRAEADEAGAQLFVCTACGYFSKKKYNVQEHVRVKHLPIQAILQCSVCSQTFHSRSSLRSHKWRFHRGEAASVDGAGSGNESAQFLAIT